MKKGDIRCLDNGNEIEATGRVDNSYSITLYEFKVLEGRDKDELCWRFCHQC